MVTANTTGLGGWGTALTQARAFIDQLTIEEKFTLVTGTAGWVPFSRFSQTILIVL